jgi:hypothetical protein
MNRIGHLKDGQVLTSGEKALVVMLMAGVFGYWAGFNLSTPGDAVGLPVTSASAAQPAPMARPANVTSLVQAPQPAPAGVAALTANSRDEAPSPTL